MDTSTDEPEIDFFTTKCKWVYVIKRVTIAIILAALSLIAIAVTPIIAITFTCWTWIATLVYYISVIAHYKYQNA